MSNYLKTIPEGEQLHFRFTYSKEVHPDKVLFQVFGRFGLQYEALIYVTDYKILQKLVNDFGDGLERELSLNVIDGEVISPNLLN